MSQSSAKIAAATALLEEFSKKEPTTEQIRQRAYEIYISRADAPGDELKDWLQAERELRSK